MNLKVLRKPSHENKPQPPKRSEVLGILPTSVTCGTDDKQFSARDSRTPQPAPKSGNVATREKHGLRESARACEIFQRYITTGDTGRPQPPGAAANLCNLLFPHIFSFELRRICWRQRENASANDWVQLPREQRNLWMNKLHSASGNPRGGVIIERNSLIRRFT